jgi:AAA15 family ATPase/GTPase
VLLRFSVSNFGSLREKQELSLIASKLKGDAKGLIEAPELRNETILPAAVIYGPNASGKSNLIKALGLMRSLVLNSHREGEPGEAIPLKPFALDPEYLTKSSFFESDFICNGALYSYSFEATAQRIVSESLHVVRETRPSVLFERHYDEFKFGRGLRGRNKIIEDLTRPNSLFLSAAAQNNHEELGQVANFFRRIHVGGLNNFQPRTVSTRLAAEEFSPKAIEILKAIEVGVIGFKVDEWPTDDRFNRMILRRVVQGDLFGVQSTENNPDSRKERRFRLGHPTASGEPIYFDLADESAGTVQLLIILGPIFRALDRGAVIVFDEFGSRVHTRASEIIISLFNSKETNTAGAQLIVATHDTNLLNSSYLRRDQVWFTEKNNSGVTHLYPLSDFVTRKDDNLEKGYLQGRFGAIPFAGSVEDLFRSG